MCKNNQGCNRGDKPRCSDLLSQWNKADGVPDSGGGRMTNPTRMEVATMEEDVIWQDDDDDGGSDPRQ